MLIENQLFFYKQRKQLMQLTSNKTIFLFLFLFLLILGFVQRMQFHTIRIRMKRLY